MIEDTATAARGVQIGDDAAYVRISRIGSRVTEEGFVSALVEVKAGPLAGVVREDTLMGVSAFCDELEALHASLSGRAEIAGYERFKLIVQGNGKGAVDGRVEVTASHVPLSKLIFELSIDQTFLPKIIRGLRQEFANS